MKKLVYIYLGIAAIFVSFQFAEASQEMPMRPLQYSAQLTSFDIDPGHHYAAQVTGGRVVINETNNHIDLILNLGMPACPPNMACIMMMPAPVMERIQITEDIVNECGIRMVTGVRDERPVDGIYQRITVYDNTRNECPTFLPLAATEVEHTINYFDRLNGQSVSMHSTFEGVSLKRPYRQLDFEEFDQEGRGPERDPPS